MGNSVVRRATDGDIERLMALYEAFHAFHVRGLPDRLRIPERGEEGEIRQALASILNRDDAAIFVAEGVEGLAGLVEVYRRQDEPSPFRVSYVYGYVQSLVVAQRWRTQGLGRQLMDAARTWAREQGATQMRLEMWEFAEGPLHFYEKLGYRTIRRTLALSLSDCTT
jgi:GNAT superfamily N-acetyltransferase